MYQQASNGAHWWDTITEWYLPSTSVSTSASSPSVLHDAGGEIDRLARQRGPPLSAGPNQGHNRNPAREPRHDYRMSAPALASTIAPTKLFEASVARK